jgi:hypothetical protein
VHTRHNTVSTRPPGAAATADAALASQQRHRANVAAGKSTLGVHGEDALRRLLAVRLHREKAQVVRFPLRFTCASKSTTTGKTYITVPIDVEGHGLRNFIVDTGEEKTTLLRFEGSHELSAP